MSKGPGAIENRIADLLAATRDRWLNIDEITDNAYSLAGATPTRAQRLAATRAVHRVLKRVRDTDARADQLSDEAWRKIEAALGPRPDDETDFAARSAWRAFDAELEAVDAERLRKYVRRIGIWTRLRRENGRIFGDDDFWCTATVKGRLYLHPPDAPCQVWAVSIQPAGVVWAEAEVTKITERNVIVCYAGSTARLDRRRLWHWWALWRGVRFVSSRTGRIAEALDQEWQDRYGFASGGAAPPFMQMALAEAIALLGVPPDFTRDDVIVAFRREVKKAHPDLGGTAEMFRKLVEARDRLLAAIGTSEAAPKMPAYYPSGVTIRYTTVRLGSSRRQLGGGAMRRLARS